MALRDEVVELIGRIIKVPATILGGNAGLGTVDNWDSLNHTLLILELENTYNVAFDFDELDQVVTVDAIIASLEKKGVGGVK